MEAPIGTPLGFKGIWLQAASRRPEVGAVLVAGDLGSDCWEQRAKILLVLYGTIWYSYRRVYNMVWYGMVWYGMVWYGMVWYGMVWYGMVWYGMVWYGMVWYGMVWYGMVWYGMEWHGMAWHGMAWHGMAWHGMVWKGGPGIRTPLGCSSSALS